MSQNTTQAALPVNSYEQNTISLNRDSFLKTVKKLHKHLQAEPKDEFKLSDIQEALAKALGNRNWRELDEKFQNTSTTMPIIQTTENNTVEPSKIEKFSEQNLIKLLKSLNASQISKLLSFNVHSAHWGENAKKLSNVVAILISQTINKITLNQIYGLHKIENLYQIYQDVTNNNKASKIVLTDHNEDDEEYKIDLTLDLKKAIVSYIQLIPQYELIERTDENSLKLPSGALDYHGYSVAQITNNYYTLLLLNEDFIIFKHQWLVNDKQEFEAQYKQEHPLNKQLNYSEMQNEWQDNSWLFHLTPIFRLIQGRRKTSNWSYPYEYINTVSFSDLFYLYAMNVIDEKGVDIKKNISNILDNIYTYKELSEKTAQKYD